MAAITLADFKARARMLFGMHEDPTESVKDKVDRLYNSIIFYQKDTTDAMAADATAEQSFYRVRYPMRIDAVYYVPRAAVTANATNFASILLDKRAAADYTTAVNLYSRSLAATNMVAFTPDAAGTLAAEADRTLTAGDVLTFEITKTMAGVVIPAGALVIYATEL